MGSHEAPWAPEGPKKKKYFVQAGLGWAGPCGPLGLGDPWALGTLGPWGPLGLGDPWALGILGLGDPWALQTLGLLGPGPLRESRKASKSSETILPVRLAM